MIAKLHYITQDVQGKSHAQLAEEACRAGADWIQLRVKNTSCAEWRAIALETQEVCKKFNARLIINDSMTLARDIGADGVHLGLKDLSTAEARKALGSKFIIGGSANTFADIAMHVRAGVDYVGVGPFRFTSTKEKLSPVLGLEGYQAIVAQCRKEHMTVPLIAIGGVLAADVAALLHAGVYGVAVSSAITLAGDKAQTIFNFNTALNSGAKVNTHEIA